MSNKPLDKIDMEVIVSDHVSASERNCIENEMESLDQILREINHRLGILQTGLCGEESSTLRIKDPEVVYIVKAILTLRHAVTKDRDNIILYFMADGMAPNYVNKRILAELYS
tara:strand:+ start:373 stop:711 length:339 start_codon:yes stop_codon:yes gene_type:complete